MARPTPTVVIGIDAAVSALVEQYLEAGIMPNLAKIIERGAYTRARSVFPGVTPINWATISTGAYPGDHGITDFGVMEPGDPLDAHGGDSFYGTNYQAETLWQAASRAGLRTATINFPGAEERQHENHLWVAGRGSPAAHTSYAIANTRCFATAPYADGLRDSELIKLADGTAAFELAPQYKPGSGPVLRAEVQAGGVRVTDGSTGDVLADLTLNQPSGWLWGDFVVDGDAQRGSYRLELIKLDAEAPAFAIYVSQITHPGSIAQPGEMGEKLVEALGPFLGYCGARGYDRGWANADRMVEEGRYKGLWQARAARWLIEHDERDLVMLKWHLLDHLQHAIWGSFDPISPWYGEELTAEMAEALMADAYRAADEMIGELLPLLDAGATLVVVSDHGHLPHLRAVAINNLFVEQGMIALKPGEENPPAVDWANTQAYGGPALGHIRVNLAGRQPEGSVPEGEYETVRQRIIDTLLALEDPETGQHPIEKAIRVEQAQGMGLWGERSGDVIYWMAPGYSGDFNWTPLSRGAEVITPMGPGGDLTAEYGEGKFIAHKFQSVHGCGSPVAELGRGTELAIFAMAGPNIRAGAEALSEPPELTTVTPTLAAATGLPRPADSTNQVLEAWVKG